MTRHANVERFAGLAREYDAIRPQPPRVALDVLCEMAVTPRPALVVDLGSGTGLSTRAWIGLAERIIGIEPNDEMRAEAERSTPAGAIEYRPGRAEATDLPDGCADLITCVQSLHWMDPQATFREAHRCLRPGGVFAALDCDWPPFVLWQLVDPWIDLHHTADRIVADNGLATGLRHWDKTTHLDRMRASGCFRAVTEIGFHARTSGGAEHLLMLARSQGGLQTALRAKHPEAEAALTAFSVRVRQTLGDRVVPWTYTYRARIGVT
jgi:SAM-dependent methyltransferase